MCFAFFLVAFSLVYTAGGDPGAGGGGFNSSNERVSWNTSAAASNIDKFKTGVYLLLGAVFFVLMYALYLRFWQFEDVDSVPHSTRIFDMSVKPVMCLTHTMDFVGDKTKKNQKSMKQLFALAKIALVLGVVACIYGLVIVKLKMEETCTATSSTSAYTTVTVEGCAEYNSIERKMCKNYDEVLSP